MWPKGSIYKEKRRSLRTDAWGTPYNRGEDENTNLPIATEKHLFDKYETNRSRAFPEIPTHLFSLAMRMAGLNDQWYQRLHLCLAEVRWSVTPCQPTGGCNLWLVSKQFQACIVGETQIGINRKKKIVSGWTLAVFNWLGMQQEGQVI